MLCILSDHPQQYAELFFDVQNVIELLLFIQGLQSVQNVYK